MVESSREHSDVEFKSSGQDVIVKTLATPSEASAAEPDSRDQTAPAGTSETLEDTAEEASNLTTDNLDDSAVDPKSLKIIPTFRCANFGGLEALCYSIDYQQPSVVVPSEANLIATAKVIGLEDSSNFSGDQLQQILQAWGIANGHNLALGIMIDGCEPYTITEVTRGVKVIWVHNDTAQQQVPAQIAALTTGHWSGMSVPDSDTEELEEFDPSVKILLRRTSYANRVRSRRSTMPPTVSSKHVNTHLNESKIATVETKETEDGADVARL